MRISKIKLSGFKSFVDPTTLTLPGKLTGVVGPNGCGKSNIIDAVLWVMGESSAKHLRGDSMVDVIFNGSSSRKPVGQAVVEIVLDNSSGTLGGQYAQYAEISIKRQVNRDGVSGYFLNNARCRRRDILDVFLGTGLGSRSYSVIEQGMISRIVEARPEDLRLFLEEAAGISRYKDRRRETETRLRHTQENLTRLTDIRQELDKQLEHLQQQAKTAEKYQRLKSEERRVKADLLALNWRQLQTEAEERHLLLQQQETVLEGIIARLRGIETQLEQERAARVWTAEHYNEAQRDYYSLSAEITQLEQSLQHAKERQDAVERDLASATRQVSDNETDLERHQQSLHKLRQELMELEPVEEQLQEEVATAQDELAEAEQAMQLWQKEWDVFTAKTHEQQRIEQRESARLEQLRLRQGENRRRLQDLEQENAGVDVEALEAALSELTTNLTEAEQAGQALREAREDKQQQAREVREAIKRDQQMLHQQRSQQQQKQGRLSALEAMQRSALSDMQPPDEWLRGLGLEHTLHLAQRLEVEPGWETAVETVFQGYLKALPVDDLDEVHDAVQALKQGIITLIDGTAMEYPALMQSDLPTLADKVKNPWADPSILRSTYIVETLAEALSRRPQLQAHESVVTRDGVWIGPNWLKAKRHTDSSSGILVREHELKTLAAELEALESILVTTTEKLERQHEQVEALEREEQELRAKLAQARETTNLWRTQHAASQAQFQQVSARKQRLLADIAHLQQQTGEIEAAIAAADQQLTEVAHLLDIAEQERVRYAEQQNELQQCLRETREHSRLQQERRHAVEVRIQTLRAQRQGFVDSLKRSEDLVRQFRDRNTGLQQSQTEVTSQLETLKARREQALERHVYTEKRFQETRSAMEALETRLTGLEQERSQCDKEQERTRTQLEQNRLEAQSLQIRLQGYYEQLQASGHELDTLLKELPEKAEIESWQERARSLERKIERLGPINLAAIDECKALEERQQYLTSQQNDLAEAVAILEGAIRKIDKETKDQFKETFDKVNKGLQAMFPRLFGGGQAYLEMTDENILEAGVSFMARPPGKRNSTIHLLSGGEKALTALSLVFAIFELNPAPFCLLDEVDAPLDDANVVRLCGMLKTMSEQVQFLFVTHHKVTMEIADRLIGVTMQEAGVSRLVAVDIDEAVRMAATG